MFVLNSNPNQHNILETKIIFMEGIIMSQNIQKQLENVIYGCASPCHSKRADKFNDAIDTSWKIYANSSFDDMLDLTKNFGKFIREFYPDKTRAYQIGPDVVQAYFDSKTDRWKDETMWTNYSRLKKLEKCCKHVYFRDKDKFDWDMENIVIPKSTKENAYSKDKPIPADIADAAIADLEKIDSEAVNGVKFSNCTGMRAEETTCLKVKNVHFDKGEFGFGWIQIVKGPEGGAKGGRARRIPILDKADQDMLKSVVARKKPEDYVVAKDNGEKMTPDRVENAFCEVLKERHGDTYLYNGLHGLRKTFAQRYYNIIRDKCEKTEAVAKTNQVLGHGYKRGPNGLKSYVANIH